MRPLFADRSNAGRCLAQRLLRYANREDAIVIGLPRGGVRVGFEIARELHLPLDVLVLKKIGAPGREELAMGAVAADGTFVRYEASIAEMRVDEALFSESLASARLEAQAREKMYRAHRAERTIADRLVIVVDDGLATGSTMLAAVAVLRARAAAKIVVVVPVAPREVARAFETLADDFVCLAQPEPFAAVGAHYGDFRQTSDEEVRELLDLNV